MTAVSSGGARVISFIVPAHNEARLIGATLDALHAVAGSLDEPCEILVVDDASTDRTATIARDRGVAVVRVEHRHIAATRNAGARHARGDRLFFVDADTLVDRAVVSAALAAMDAGAVGGGAAVRLRGPLAMHERGLQSLSIVLFRTTRIAPGCFVFCTRAAFDAAGGFDERYYAAEDIAISRALARQGRFVVLREAVHTSARKLRTFSFAEQLRFLARLTVGGRRMLRSRHHLDLWYGKRRDEEY
jgi:glycosyltransferase involved in cell wall biosynthesis